MPVLEKSWSDIKACTEIYLTLLFEGKTVPDHAIPRILNLRIRDKLGSEGQRPRDQKTGP